MTFVVLNTKEDPIQFLSIDKDSLNNHQYIFVHVQQKKESH